MKRIICTLLIILSILLFTGCEKEEDKVKRIIDEVIESHASILEEYDGTSDDISDWFIFATLKYDNFNDIILNKKEQIINNIKIVLSDSNISLTQRIRKALVLKVLSPDDFEKANVLMFNDINYQEQSLNAIIWSLILIGDSKQEQLNHQLIDLITKAELDEGGFTLFGSNADIDLTAMAIVALAPFYQEKNVKMVIDKALTILYSAQTSKGDFTSINEASLESSIWSVLALISLNQDPLTYYEYNPLTGIFQYYLNDGNFTHQLTNKKANDYTTYQALYGLIAYYRFINGEAFIF